MVFRPEVWHNNRKPVDLNIQRAAVSLSKAHSKRNRQRCYYLIGHQLWVNTHYDTYDTVCEIGRIVTLPWRRQRERRFRSNWGGGGDPLTAAAAVPLVLTEKRGGLSSVTTQYRGGKPAVLCGDAEYVESQRAGGQSVSTGEQVELFALARPLSGCYANTITLAS